MTVEELITELNKIENKTLEVVTEGCDCDGDVATVDVEFGSVMLRRSEVRWKL